MPARTRRPKSSATPAGSAGIDADMRRARIAIAAYYKAERRDFAPGREVEDWLEAEREFDAGPAGPAAAAADTPAASPAGMPPTSPGRKRGAGAGRKGAPRAPLVRRP